MFRTIVVGLDGSPRQNTVLEHAVRIADTMGGRLHLCRAMQIPLSVPAVAWSLKGDDFGNFLVEHATTALQRIQDELPEGLVRGITCRLGAPADVLTDIAKEILADLLVIGSHGYDRIDRLIGTTASRVTNISPCSVLVIKGDA